MPDLRAGESGSEALFLHATEGILVVDSAGLIIRINPSAEKLFGYNPDELLGQKIEVLVPRNLVKRHHEHREQYSRHSHARKMGSGFDLYGLRKNGSEFPVEISLSPYETADEKFVIAFIVDITLRKQAEERLKNYSAELEKQVKNRTLILEEAIDELEKTKRNLNESLEKERDLNEMKSRFVSMASHEFRTPLATILSSLSLVTKYGELNETEKQNKHIGRIKASITNLTDILNDFLSITKLEEGKVAGIPKEMDLPEFVQEVIKELEPLLKKNQKIAYNHKGRNRAKLDQQLLRNILFNLISNASKFSDEGKPIDIETNCTDKEICLTVMDQGIGISKADQKHLFERFFRAHNASNIQGTGLGLFIVSQYAKLMNGSVELKSEEHKGTVIKLILPQ